MSFCSKCGREITGKGKFCAGCGAEVKHVSLDETLQMSGVEENNISGDLPDMEEIAVPEAKVVEQPILKPQKERKVSSHKNWKQGFLKTCKIALMSLIIVFVLAGVGYSLFISLKPSPTLDTPSGERTMDSDGVLAVKLEYADGALLFSNLDTARMHMVLTNVSNNIIRDVSMEVTFPDGLRYVGAEESVKVDVLSPGSSYTITLPVEKVNSLDDHFYHSLFILAVVVLVGVMLLFVYGTICGKYRKSMQPVVAICLVISMLMPYASAMAEAAENDSELVYEEGKDVATAISTIHNSESQFKLGDSRKSSLSYSVEYFCEEHLLLDASLEEGGTSLTLVWNEISNVEKYRIYTTDYEGNFYQLDETEDTEYSTDIPAYESIIYYRVVAETELGDLYTNDLRVIATQKGTLYTDNDEDLLSNTLETVFGTSTILADTDGDGVTDYDEIAITMTDPLVYDTDNNGISDGEEDMDSDGLNTIFELENGTSPLESDSDGDGLPDQIEVEVFFSNPLLQDTDGDGLWDDSEYQLGTDPNNTDTDGDGVLDGDDSYVTDIAVGEDGISIEVTDTGDNITAVEVKEISDDTVFGREDYIASPVVSVEIAESSEATVTLPIVGSDKESEIVVVVYNEEDNDFQVVQGATISSDGSSVSAPISNMYYTEKQGLTDEESTVTTRRSTYVALYIANWHAKFEASLSPDREGEAFFDVSFVIDESGSMEDSSKGGTVNDPNRYRVEAAKRFTEALVEGDRAAVVGFNESARRKISLTEDMYEVRSAIDSIVGNAGGTALYRGLQESVRELVEVNTADRGQFIIALTDGVDNNSDNGVYDQVIETCVQYQIPIYTIGLGSSVNTALLTRLATYTGGTYINIKTADDLPQVFNRIENTAFYGDDTDGDGLADVIEDYGLRDGTGVIYYTDDEKRFTDDDDLSDGEEAGNVMYTDEDENGNSIAYYLMVTDPTKADTDGDGVDDLDERIMKTLPWCSDTDGDGLSDGEEMSLGYDPVNANPDGDYYIDSLEATYSNWNEIALQIIGDCNDNPETMVMAAIFASVSARDPYTYDLCAPEKGAALLEGALLGDVGDILAKYGIMDSRYVDSIYYYIGGVIISFIPTVNVIATIRDAIACAIDGDLPGMFLNLVGLIPGGDATVETIQLVCDILQYAGDGLDAVAEYPSSVTAQKAAAAPALTYLLLRILREIEDTFGTDIGTENVKKMVESQIDMGVQGLTKENMQNWEAFLSYGKQTMDDDEKSEGAFYPHRAADALNTEVKIQLTISNISTPLTLVSSVRQELGQAPGGMVNAVEDGYEYTLVRALDLECTEYQDSIVLRNALYDSVDRVASYADVKYGTMHKKMQLVVTDSLVSKEVYNVLSGIGGYAEEKGVKLESYLYLTTDDTDYNPLQENINPSKKKDAIIILPGIAGSELVAGEDYSGGLLRTIVKGEMVWLPEVASDVINKNLGGLNGDQYKDSILEVVDALNMMQMDENGSSLYHVIPKAVSPDDKAVGTLDSATGMYQTLLERFGDEYDVVFFSYDWRKSVTNAAKELENYIKGRGYDEVNFVCHSMGGIVCSTYLASSEANRDITNQVITVGTPYGGAPKAAYVFESGNFIDFGVKAIDYAFLQIARNLPSVYELLPYDDSIDFNGSYLIVDTASGQTSAETYEYLLNSDFDLNDRMLDEARKVQKAVCVEVDGELDHVMNHEDVNCTIIAGYNCDTMTRLYVDGERITIAGSTIGGDGTVPLVSAIERSGKLFDNPIYLVNGVEHMKLFSDPDVVDLVVGILGEEDEGTYNQVKITRPEENDTSDSFICRYLKAQGKEMEETQKEVEDIRDSFTGDIYDLIIAYCPVALSLYSAEGELMGTVSSEGITVAENVDADMFELLNAGETKQVVVPQGCTVTINGEAEGTMDIVVATMNSRGELVQKSLYDNLQVMPEMIVKASINDVHEGTLEIDIDGNGEVEETLTVQDAKREVYMSLEEDSGRDYRLWVLLGASAGLIVGVGLALFIITVRNRPKKNKDE